MASTLFGILFFSVVVGFVVDAVRDKMDELKQGKTRVYVENLLLYCYSSADALYYQYSRPSPCSGTRRATRSSSGGRTARSRTFKRSPRPTRARGAGSSWS